MSERQRLRPDYDLALPSLDIDPGSRGMVYRAIPAGSRVLDVGCDTGRFGGELKQRKGCTVCGIESDALAAEAARARLDQVQVQEIHDESSFAGLTGFDVVLFLDVLEHLADPWAALAGARRSLRIGGKLFVVVPNIAHISVVRRLLKGEFEYVAHGTMDRTHLRWFTRKSLSSALLRAGFDTNRVEPIPLLPRFGDTALGRIISRPLVCALPDLFGGSLLGVGCVSSPTAGVDQD